MSTIQIKVSAITSLLISFLFLYLRTIRARLPYNEQGQYFDVVTGVNYDIQAVSAFTFIAVMFMLPALVGLTWLVIKK